MLVFRAVERRTWSIEERIERLNKGVNRNISVTSCIAQVIWVVGDARDFWGSKG